MTYQNLTLSPDIAFGKFGIGLELTLHYTFTDEAGVDPIRVEGDWIPDPALNQNYLDVYLPKFKYIRYGFKGDPLYAKLGSIEDGTLGNGFIMNNYDNTLFLPEQRIFGLAFDLDGALFNFPYLGLETFVGNVAHFDVLGARLYARPLAGTEIPLLKNLQVGATFAMDTDPGLHTDRPPGPGAGVPVRGRPAPAHPVQPGDQPGGFQRRGGAGQPELRGRHGGLRGTARWGHPVRGPDPDAGRELRAGVLRLHLRPVPRTEKYAIAIRAGGPRARLHRVAGQPGLLPVRGPAGVQRQPGRSVPSRRRSDNYLDWPHLFAQFILGKGLVPNVSLELSYDKRNLAADEGFFQDLFSFAESVIQGRLNYSIGAAVLSLVYDIRWDPLRGKWITHSGIETAIELF